MDQLNHLIIKTKTKTKQNKKNPTRVTAPKLLNQRIQDRAQNLHLKKKKTLDLPPQKTVFLAEIGKLAVNS